MTELALEQCCDDADWANFLRNSPQACIYNEAATIGALGCKADYWFIMRNGYPAAAIPVITHNQAGDGLPMHSYYTGLMLHNESWNCKANRRTENLLAITQACMQQLASRYDTLQFCLHPDITDVRGFDWFNYHTPEAGRASISPRYTAQLRLDTDTIRSSARSSRRREEKYASEREQLNYTVDGTAAELCELWRQSLARQSCPPDDIEMQITLAFAEYCLASERAIIATTRDDAGVACTAGLILFDYNGRVHLPVVGTSDTRYGGTMLYFNMMDTAAERGYRVMDFNGANSPSRGYFKHSIGGDTTLYFHISWLKP